MRELEKRMIHMCTTQRIMQSENRTNRVIFWFREKCSILNYFFLKFPILSLFFDFKIFIDLYTRFWNFFEIKSNILRNKKRPLLPPRADIFRSTIFNYLSDAWLHYTTCAGWPIALELLILANHWLFVFTALAYYFCFRFISMKRPDDTIICQIFDECHIYVNFTALPCTYN